jgi:hypothetical protein
VFTHESNILQEPLLIGNLVSDRRPRLYLEEHLVINLDINPCSLERISTSGTNESNKGHALPIKLSGRIWHS